MSDAIRDWDIKTGEIQWNQAIKFVFGHAVACYAIEWWEQHIHPDDLDEVKHQFQQLMESKKSRLQLEYCFHADGTYKCVLDRSFILLMSRQGRLG